VSNATIVTRDLFEVVHTGPGTLAGRYLHNFWQPVMPADQLAIGRAKPLRIMSEDFTVYRGQDGTAQVVAPYCPHRGTMLSTGWVEGNALRCFYHGWKFGPHGQCLEAPGERDGFAKNIHIRSYPTHEYKGLIFAFLGEGAAPAFPLYSSLDGGFIEATQYTRGCNFFNSIENQCDPVHVAFTHRVSSFTEGGLIGVPLVSAEETSWGLAVTATRDGVGARLTQIGMPNLLHIRVAPTTAGAEWNDMFAWRVPVDDGSHLGFNVWVHRQGKPAAKPAGRTAPESPIHSWPIEKVGAAYRRGDLGQDDIRHHPDLIGIQDDIVQVGQGVIARRADETLGRSDVGVVLIRKLWLRELRALETGAPLKAWQWSPALEATSGTSAAAE
jgi:5,5'-dehydrodivanillate O-demethylase oxygenase subunit